MTRMVARPTCKETLAVTQYGKCVVCGRVIAEEVESEAPPGNGAAYLSIGLGALLVLAGLASLTVGGRGIHVTGLGVIAIGRGVNARA